MTRRQRPRTSEERLITAVASVARGVVGGRVRNVGQAAPLVRNTGPSAPLHDFDPNEGPVIIGNGSTAGGGSNPDDVSAGHIDAVAIGDAAQATADDTVAIGDGPAATAANTVAIGNGPAAVAAGSVAIGLGPLASGINSTIVGSGEASGANSSAYGQNSGAFATDSTAIGYNSHVAATHTHSSAFGADAVTTADHQVMLGSAADTVVIPGTLTAAGITGGGHPVAVADSAGTVASDVSTVEFTGTAVTSVTDDGSGHVTVTLTAGSGGGGGGGAAPSIVTVADGDTLADATIALANPAGSLFHLTLPNPTGNGRMTVKSTGTTGAGLIEIAHYGTELLDGVSGFMHLRDGDSVTLISDGANWWSI